MKQDYSAVPVSSARDALRARATPLHTQSCDRRRRMHASISLPIVATFFTRDRRNRVRAEQKRSGQTRRAGYQALSTQPAPGALCSRNCVLGNLQATDGQWPDRLRNCELEKSQVALKSQVSLASLIESACACDDLSLHFVPATAPFVTAHSSSSPYTPRLSLLARLSAQDCREIRQAAPGEPE
ncbi:hypothetical protein ACVWYH_008664 [Bradyrhizobium sp. GM24.11]